MVYILQSNPIQSNPILLYILNLIISILKIVHRNAFSKIFRERRFFLLNLCGVPHCLDIRGHIICHSVNTKKALGVYS